MAGPDYIFITGASRSGTTLLSFALRNHPDVFGLREMQYFGDAWDPRDPARRFTRHEAVTEAARLYAIQEYGILNHSVQARHRQTALALVDSLGESAADPAELFVAVTRRMARAHAKSIPCEQTPRYIYYGRPLLERYPGAHIVHIVRDPRAVMASQKNRWRRRGLAANASAVPRYESMRVWINYHPYTVARLWRQATREALALRDHPRCTVLRYEDLVLQPEATLRELCDRLGLQFDPAMLEVRQVNSSHDPVSQAPSGMRPEAIDRWRRALTRAEVAATERICRSLMDEFGYPRASTRIAPVGELGFAMSYLGHVAAVMAVNPKRAAVQARALLPGGTRAAPAAPRSTPTPGQPTKQFLGLRFWDPPLDQAARHIVDCAARGERVQVFFVNAHCINQAAHDPVYAGLLADAPFLFADGFGMAIAARLAGQGLAHNVNGTDLFPVVCLEAARAGLPIALLGAQPGVADACADAMRAAVPGLEIPFTAHGYLGPMEEEAALERLNQSGARILFVAKGVPQQERWMATHAARIAPPVTLGVGALFDFYSGRVARAPRLVRQLRSEWLYRLLQEPRRLGTRYLLGNPAFIARTLLWRSVGHPPVRNDRRLT